MSEDSFVQCIHLYKSYPVPDGQGKKQVLNDISFCLPQGQCLGLLGTSGCGKSTLARLILGLERPDAGTILVQGIPLKQWQKQNRGSMSVVFQDYNDSLNPSFTIFDIVREGFVNPLFPASEEAIVALLAKMHLEPSLLQKYPYELSGGQAQRVALARALASHPSLLILDEAVSALDVAVQVQLLTLLCQIKQETTCLFITHDLQAAAFVCDHFLFMEQGCLVASVRKEDVASCPVPLVQNFLAHALPFVADWHA